MNFSDEYDDEENDEYEEYERQFQEEAEQGLPTGTEQAQGTITAVPTLLYYQKRYGLSCSNNDQKAVRMFKEYESMEKVRRLQAELMWVSSEQVYTPVLDNILGKTRRVKHDGYHKWGKLMLVWLAQYQRG